MKRAIILALAALWACGSSDDSSGDAVIHPGTVYSGFDDGTTTFSVPASAINVADKTTVKWSVGDSSIADVVTEDPQPGEPPAKATHHVYVNTKKAGKTVLRATIGGTRLEVPLIVTQYSPGAASLGNDLYQVDNPGATQGPTGGDYVHGLGCIGCHGAKGGPRHSPSELGGYPDDAILQTIATGVKPNGDPIQVATGTHKFTLDDKQKEAILARLRSLAPIDWPK